MSYIIESIRDIETGAPHEREARRKGHRVDIVRLPLFRPMVLAYVDEEDAYLTTSNVMSYHGKGADSDVLTVTTRNTIYTLRREVAEPGEE